MHLLPLYTFVAYAGTTLLSLRTHTHAESEACFMVTVLFSIAAQVGAVKLENDCKLRLRTEVKRRVQIKFRSSQHKSVKQKKNNFLVPSNVLLESQKCKDCLGCQRQVIILKRILRKQEVESQTIFTWIMIRTNGGILSTRSWTLRFHNCCQLLLQLSHCKLNMKKFSSFQLFNYSLTEWETQSVSQSVSHSCWRSHVIASLCRDS